MCDIEELRKAVDDWDKSDRIVYLLQTRKNTYDVYAKRGASIDVVLKNNLKWFRFLLDEYDRQERQIKALERRIEGGLYEESS